MPEATYSPEETSQEVLESVSLSSTRTITAAQAALAGPRRYRLRHILPFIGPAFIAAVAYIDPGNFATNIQAGSQFGYLLLWVILGSNLMAILLQTLSAKLGIATGRNLPELCHSYLPQPVNIGLWIIAEIGAIATDMAEFIGAAIGFNLLFHIPLFVAGLLTGVATFAILALLRFGFRPLEAVITSLVAIIAISYLIESVIARPNLGQVALHTFVPQFAGPNSVLLAVGILGATVMPHVIYLHSALVQERILPQEASDKHTIFKFEQIDIWVAMGVAGLVNIAMLLMAAGVFYTTGHTEVASLEIAYKTLTPLLGNAASTIFGIALLASGLSSSAVGTLAGQVIMQGFIARKLPVWLRRMITMLPALIVIALGWNPTQTLIISQVVLSFVLPFAIVPLLFFTNRRDVMGELVNRPVTRLLGWSVAVLIILLNCVLVYQTLGGR